jgi:hypothetical protein
LCESSDWSATNGVVILELVDILIAHWSLNLLVWSLHWLHWLHRNRVDAESIFSFTV